MLRGRVHRRRRLQHQGDRQARLRDATVPHIPREAVGRRERRGI